MKLLLSKTARDPPQKVVLLEGSPTEMAEFLRIEHHRVGTSVYTMRTNGSINGSNLRHTNINDPLFFCEVEAKAQAAATARAEAVQAIARAESFQAKSRAQAVQADAARATAERAKVEAAEQLADIGNVKKNVKVGDKDDPVRCKKQRV